MEAKKKPLVMIQLNELNFDVVREYLAAGWLLPSFEKLLEFNQIITSSEDQYDLLEPWIQWPSVHTGLPFADHQIFRLGDTVSASRMQVFELIEAKGFRVGAICPMNATNALENPAYFLPDPWTATPSDNSLLSRMLTSALRQAVNDNSEGKITLKTFLFFGACFLGLVSPYSYPSLVGKAVKSLGKPWRKALFLDAFLHEVHLTLLKRTKPNFSSIFLNAGAHIQHHYFFNSLSASSRLQTNPTWYVSQHDDPVGEMLIAYDSLLKDYLVQDQIEVIVATGLTQRAVDESVFYYRLRDHEEFLGELGIPFEAVLPRMTRDFLVSFSTAEDATLFVELLQTVVTREGVPIFGEIDNRGLDVFVVLTYASEIVDAIEIWLGKRWVRLLDHVVFVAVKNGEHESRGFAFFSPGIATCAPTDGQHVSSLFTTVCSYFGPESVSNDLLVEGRAH